MSDYSYWNEYQTNLMNDIFANIKLINDNKNNIELRNQHINKCVEWLRVNEIMVNRVKNAQERANHHLQILNGEICDACLCKKSNS